MPLEIIPVTTRSQMETFLELPLQLYDSAAKHKIVPPKLEQSLFNPTANPFLHHTFWECYLALEDKIPSGRIAAMIDEEFPEKNTGFFGFFECRSSGQAAPALLNAAEKWLAANGKTEITGPVSMSTCANVGLLIEGFEQENPFFLSYNPPYYQHFLNVAGYKKLTDFYAYTWLNSNKTSDRLYRISSRLKKAPDIKIRTISYKQLKSEAEAFLAIYNSSMVKNWGHTPLTHDEAKYILASHRRQVPPEFFLFVEVRQLPAALCMAIPHRQSSSMRLAVLAARPEFNHLGLSALLVAEIIQTAHKYHLSSAELSYVQENNTAVNNLIQKDVGSKITKRYRLYSKQLK